MKISQGRLRIGVATAAIVLGAATVVHAALPPPDPGEPVVHGCYNRQTDKVRVIARNETCATGQLAMTWGPQPNTPGPQGATGPAGPVGPAGPAGLDRALLNVIPVTVTANTPLTVQPVTCTPGQVAVGGGAVLVRDNLYKDSFLVGSSPHQTDRGQWVFSIRTDPFVTADWRLSVLCYPAA